MIHLGEDGSHRIAGLREKLNGLKERVLYYMFWVACEIPSFSLLFRVMFYIRGQPNVLHFK